MIREKNPSHPKVKNFSYEEFQQSIFEFLRGYMDDSEPALLTVCVLLHSKSNPFLWGLWGQRSCSIHGTPLGGDKMEWEHEESCL